MHIMYSGSNGVTEWLSVVKMLKTEIHLFRYSSIPYCRFYSLPICYHMKPYTFIVNDLALPINVLCEIIIVTRHILSVPTSIIVRPLVTMYLLSSFVAINLSNILQAIPC